MWQICQNLNTFIYNFILYDSIRQLIIHFISIRTSTACITVFFMWRLRARQQCKTWNEFKNVHSLESRRKNIECGKIISFGWSGFIINLHLILYDQRFRLIELHFAIYAFNLSKLLLRPKVITHYNYVFIKWACTRHKDYLFLFPWTMSKLLRKSVR